MQIEQVDLNGNTEHATCHGVSADEIVQVFANQPRISRNRKNRSAVYSAFGRTDGGRPVRINFRYHPRAALPDRSVHGRTDEPTRLRHHDRRRARRLPVHPP